MNFKKIIPNIIAVVIFASTASWYFSPAFQGKKVEQFDIVSYLGASKEIKDYREQHNEETLWTGRVFSGMPGYFISLRSEGNLVAHLDNLLQLYLPYPIGLFFWLMLGFFILLRVFGVHHWLAICGALFFGFSSYFIILIEAGHNSKLHAISHMAPLLAMVYYTYKKKLWTGAVFASIFTALQVHAYHIQISYYLLFVVLFMVLALLFDAVKQKTLPEFFKRTLVLVIAAGIGVLPATTRLWTAYDSSKETIRGGSSELSPLADQAPKAKGGLDKEYAFQWSYGIDETLTLLFPKFMGGASSEKLDTKSHTYKSLKSLIGAQSAKNVVEGGLPTYWGKQPFTSGPTFVGVVSVFLFVFALFVLPRKHKYWLLGITVLSIALAWGKNFESLSYWFFDYVPMYNKFRAPSMFLVVAELTIPFAGILALNELTKNPVLIHQSSLYRLLMWIFQKIKPQWHQKITAAGGHFGQLFFAYGIVLLFCLWMLMRGQDWFGFIGQNDMAFANQLSNAGFPQQAVDNVMSALKLDRWELLKGDVKQALLIVTLVFGVIYFYLKQKIALSYVAVFIGLIGFYELVNLNLDYLKKEDFISSKKYDEKFKPSNADLEILKDKSYFRVFNRGVSTFNDALTSFHHHSIGGYSAAKLQLYQDLIERQIAKGNTQVLSMLNTKYVINNPNQAQSFPNLGSFWVVNNIKWVENADAEMAALDDFDPKETVIIDQRYKEVYPNWDVTVDSSAKLTFVSYSPKKLSYKVNLNQAQFVVFSEVFYKGNEDWKAYIDGEFVPHVRCNYVLRGMMVSPGNHEIEFVFDPKTYRVGERIAYAGSLLIFILLAVVLYREKNNIINYFKV